MSINLNTSILEVLGKKKAIPGDYGIEIEWEGKLKKWDEDESHFWSCKEDGSLRKGMEYVLKRPYALEDLPIVMEDFAARTKGSVPKYSSRTSVHVHFNVSRYTLKQVYSLLTFNILVERMLIHTQGVDRRGNLFCLGIHDAEAAFDQLTFSVAEGHYFSPFNIDTYKYSSLNICAINNYGSLEWRFLRGLTDVKEIEDWVRNITISSKVAAEKFDPEALLNFYRYSDPLTFLKTFYENEFLEEYIFKTAPEWKQHMKDNYQYAHELISVIKKGERKVWKVPFIKMEHEDLPESASALKAKPLHSTTLSGPTNPMYLLDSVSEDTTPSDMEASFGDWDTDTF